MVNSRATRWMVLAQAKAIFRSLRQAIAAKGTAQGYRFPGNWTKTGVIPQIKQDKGTAKGV
ncbi:hypothetical protein H6G41_29285 [Tolypothrix sp. FACHB-123]|uniref:hypothetical protein n=1 Tax=Tolypothrix sp. FACHB-123 TaxID=2692868 RepID=UPI0016846FBA|nr:hypothetical protein [Tolypothrix sp. FACHB-123]MBD2358654.1 hypothetical protein [Tolypothrix sp. FACHB-123]